MLLASSEENMRVEKEYTSVGRKLRPRDDLSHQLEAPRLKMHLDLVMTVVVIYRRKTSKMS